MSQSKTMKDLPVSERPYERCQTLGPESLTDAELLAVILRSGANGSTSLDLARDILNLCPFDSGLSGILHLTSADLMKLKGIGLVKALQIKCIGELSKRISKTTAREKLRFTDPASVAEYYMESLRHQEQELVIAAMLDTKNNFLGDVVLSKGTVNLSLISPRELFLQALAFHAVKIILVHNHPSGDPTPSDDDICTTAKVLLTGQMLGIELLDHIVIGDCCFKSVFDSDGFLQIIQKE